MSIIAFRENENNRWKRQEKENKDRKKTRGTEAIVKGWELNDFVVRLS